MKIILSNVATDKLEEAYKVYIGRVLKEAAVAPEVKPAKIVEAVTHPARVVTGNENLETESDDDKPSDQLLRMKRLAGLATR